MLYLICILKCTSWAKFSIEKNYQFNHTHKAHPRSCSIPNTTKYNNIECPSSKSLKTFFCAHHLPRLPSPETSTNSLAQARIFCTKSFWSGVKLVNVTRKCFSRRLINGMGKLLYTTSFSAITINLIKGE